MKISNNNHHFIVSSWLQNICRRQVRLCCLVHSFPVSIHNSSNWTGDGQCSSYQDLRQHMYRRVLFTLSKQWNLSSSSNYVHVHICFDVIYICSKSRQNNSDLLSMGWFLILISTWLIFTFTKKPVHIVRVTKDCLLQCIAMSCTMCTALLWEEKQIRIMVHSWTCTNIM